MQYILQYNHWQQISSTTNILKHNTEMYHCGEKTELHTGQAAFVHGGFKKNNNQKPNHNIPRFFLIEIKKAFVVDTVTTVFGKIFHIATPY